MSLFLINFFVWLLTIAGGVVFSIIFFGTSPQGDSLNLEIGFFLSLFITIAGILTILGYQLRVLINKNSGPGLAITAIRQGLLISLYIISILVMLATDSFFLWQALLLALVVILLELYFR